MWTVCTRLWGSSLSIANYKSLRKSKFSFQTRSRFSYCSTCFRSLLCCRRSLIPNSRDEIPMFTSTGFGSIAISLGFTFSLCTQSRLFNVDSK